MTNKTSAGEKLTNVVLFLLNLSGVISFGQDVFVDNKDGIHELFLVLCVLATLITSVKIVKNMNEEV